MLKTHLIDIASSRPRFTILTRATYVKGKGTAFVDVASRSTTITNSRGRVVARIEWTGKEKRSGGLIYISDGDPMKVAELFDGCDHITAESERLVIPSRLGLSWSATQRSLVLLDPGMSEVIGKLHHNSVQVGQRITPSPIPKVGTEFLEFPDMPDEIIAELLVGYIFVNIMRRTRFNLPRYRFPLVEGHSEERQSVADVIAHVRDSIGRRHEAPRRNTVF